MKRSMAGPQGQSNSSNKRPRIQNEADFQKELARILDVPDFPAEPPVLVAGPESLVRVPTSAAEKEIERLLGLDAQAKPMFARDTVVGKRSELPREFSAELVRRYQRGDIDGKVLDYYSDVLLRGDSATVPGQGGRALLLKSIMRQEDTSPSALVVGPTWRPVRVLGKGGFGEVMLWEKMRKNGPPLRIATKESRPHDFFKDYCSEAHLTRRLNDLGCKNVISVVEWAYIGEKFWRNETGKISKSEPRHRICYEYADYGDLWDLIAWYHTQRLILPEGFLWHFFYSMANALCYCCHGTNKPSVHKPGWDGIVHMDIKPENMLLAGPDPSTHQLYPCIKLADFGLAHTMGVDVAEIRYFKSAGPSGGTLGYVPPEVMDRTPERESRRRRPHELIGPHCDVYSLGKSIQNATDLLKSHHQTPKISEDTTPNRFQHGFRPNLDLVYTSDLWNLMNRCQVEDARFRPRLQYLYTETKLRMEHCRTLALAEEADASAKGIPGCFHSNVLFKKEDRVRFETDPVFRSHFRTANLKPVWDLLGPVPSRNVPRQEVKSDVGFEEDWFWNGDAPGVGEGNGNGRVGLQRGGVRARVERKAELKSKEKEKEKKKRGARVQRGIRGLLSKMNFFS